MSYRREEALVANDSRSKPYRKRAIPNHVRRAVARRYGAEPGTTILVPCHYCGVLAKIDWMAEYPNWPVFYHELDHVMPEFHGGPSTADNIVLACQRCNRCKGSKVPAQPMGQGA
jgi:5-methylcytosine-specific restriction endonuclease McrA